MERKWSLEHDNAKLHGAGLKLNDSPLLTTAVIRYGCGVPIAGVSQRDDGGIVPGRVLAACLPGQVVPGLVGQGAAGHGGLPVRPVGLPVVSAGAAPRVPAVGQAQETESGEEHRAVPHAGRQ